MKVTSAAASFVSVSGVIVSALMRKMKTKQRGETQLKTWSDEKKKNCGCWKKPFHFQSGPSYLCLSSLIQQYFDCNKALTLMAVIKHMRIKRFDEYIFSKANIY